MKCRRMDLSGTIKKLAELVSDSVTNVNTPRIIHYLDDFLSMTGNGGFVSFSNGKKYDCSENGNRKQITRLSLI